MFSSSTLAGLLLVALAVSAWRPPARAGAPRPRRASTLDDGPDLDPLLRELAALDEDGALGDSELSLLHELLEAGAASTRGGTGGRDDAWRWTESPTAVTFEVDLPSGARARDVSVDVSASAIEVRCRARRAAGAAEPLLAGRFAGAVLHEDVAWAVEADGDDARATLFVELTKRSAGLWRTPLFSDHVVAEDGAGEGGGGEADGLVEVEDRVGVARAPAAAAATRSALSSSSEALHAAASEGRARDVVAILAGGREVDVDARDKYGAGSTALLQAAYFGHGETVDALLEAGADPTLRDVDGKSPADWAAHEGHADLAETLERAVEARAGDPR